MRDKPSRFPPRRVAIALAFLVVGLLIVWTALRRPSRDAPVVLPDVVVTSRGDLVFEWPRFPDADGYMVVFYRDGSTEIARYGPFVENRFVIGAANLRGVPPSERIVWRVVGLLDGEETQASAPGAFDTPPPPQP